MKYINHIKWNDKAKQFIFKNKLKIEVLIKLIYYDIAIKILDDLIKAVIKINNKLYQFKMTTKLSRINKYYQNYNAEYYIIRRDCKSFSNQYRDLIDFSVI